MRDAESLFTVDDPAAYGAYRRASAGAFAKCGARFLVRGGHRQVVEGALRPRAAVIGFPDMAAARACCDSPAYRAALVLRRPCALADLAILGGREDA
ncbi:Uncharacterized conserved protein, DUF1330 family [Paracoccus aminovorans]|uniref:Uncharacterized conserved protein, DUF1330 family n=1 Tax=Paracoccus aminovorans TaxID=34004 RepID=A0A1I2Y3H9_9RHOB|nr:DUF1330 domain-containing protein [Paracoccus aminovorans]CQR86071.1 hypothetical protein JCM7685_1500 [Paracoccus aminovorans]SFH20318.1 Uncharacterized conserved protein, DUF1330 family [Paracoccus aminovorans]